MKLLYTHTHTHARTHTSKACCSRYIAIASEYTNAGMSGTTQTLEPGAENPPGEGLVTHSRSHG